MPTQSPHWVALQNAKTFPYLSSGFHSGYPFKQETPESGIVCDVITGWGQRVKARFQPGEWDREDCWIVTEYDPHGPDRTQVTSGWLSVAAVAAWRHS